MKGPAIWARKCPINLENFAVGQDPWILWEPPGSGSRENHRLSGPCHCLGMCLGWQPWKAGVRDEAGHDIFVVKDAEIIQQSNINEQVELIGWWTKVEIRVPIHWSWNIKNGSSSLQGPDSICCQPKEERNRCTSTLLIRNSFEILFVCCFFLGHLNHTILRLGKKLQPRLC